MSHAVLLDRDHSILKFNERVLDWACRAGVPLLERLRFLCIVSSNLDEFFEVRIEPHVRAARARERQGTYSVEAFEAVMRHAHKIVDRQYTIFNDELSPALAGEGVRIVPHGERNVAQRRWVDEYFDREVKPLLVPVGLDPAHPFPQVANKSLNFIVRLTGADAFGRDNEIAITKVPRVLPRVIRMPEKVSGTERLMVTLSSVIRAQLGKLFPGREVTQFSQFRVTRHSDLAVDEEEVANLRTALREGLVQRHFGQAVRLEVSAGCSAFLSDFLLRQFDLPASALFRVPGPVNLVRLAQMVDLVADPKLLFPVYRPAWPAELVPERSIFEQMRQRDILIHQPYESFDGVVAFLREAVRDPAVLAIRQTIYRTGADSVMMDLLREAVQAGKEVMVVVELKARFDEEANINWAEALESIGAQVVYGIVALKTHAKMLLVTRREGKALRRYGHLSTGNYNPRTARLYTDLSVLTADTDITADMAALFVHLASQSRLPKMRKLWVAPFALHKRLLEQIAEVARAARAGLDARMVLKMNALTDEPLVRALVDAAAGGARIDLIIRGACVLPPGFDGVGERIRVRSIIGRMLEHSRVFYFRIGEVERLFLSSADWMNRNMMRRVEIAWPVEDPAHIRRIVDECLVAPMHDGRDAWELQSTGEYLAVRDAGSSAQQALMRRYGGLADPHPLRTNTRRKP